MQLKEIYNDDFYNSNHINRNYSSAKIILSMLFKYYKPNSVIDIGCGVGTWLKAALDFGVSNICGVDCNEISEDKLLVPRKYINIDNLEEHSNYNNEKYDLVISVEVAEHLNNIVSEKFVKTLISYSDVVLFSAAIPYQVGEHHINCQPPEFWFNIFKKYDYVCFDFRDKLMNIGEDVAPYYAQNMLLFVHKNIENNFPYFNKVEKPIFFYHPFFVNIIVDNINILNEEIEKIKLNSSWFQLFSISNNQQFLRITLLGIKITLRMDEKNINRVLSFIPFKKWKDNFRLKFRPDQTRPDQTRPDQTRPDQTRPDQTRPDQT